MWTHFFSSTHARTRAWCPCPSTRSKPCTQTLKWAPISWVPSVWTQHHFVSVPGHQVWTRPKTASQVKSVILISVCVFCKIFQLYSTINLIQVLVWIPDWSPYNNKIRLRFRIKFKLSATLLVSHWIIQRQRTYWRNCTLLLVKVPHNSSDYFVRLL